jgi:hypothetical protein
MRDRTDEEEELLREQQAEPRPCDCCGLALQDCLCPFDQDGLCLMHAEAAVIPEGE